MDIISKLQPLKQLIYSDFQASSAPDTCLNQNKQPSIFPLNGIGGMDQITL